MPRPMSEQVYVAIGDHPPFDSMKISSRDYNRTHSKLLPRRENSIIHTCESNTYAGERTYLLAMGGVVLLDEVGKRRAITFV